MATRFEILTPDELLRREGVPGSRNRPNLRWIADALRLTLMRWGLSPRHDVLAHTQKRLRKLGMMDEGLVADTLNRLILTREIEEVRSGSTPYLCLTTPRWVKVSEEEAVLLGDVGADGHVMLLPSRPDDVLRRTRLERTSDRIALELAGIPEESLADWLAPAGYLQHVRRRERAEVREDRRTLESFWMQLCLHLREGGEELDDAVQLRVLQLDESERAADEALVWCGVLSELVSTPDETLPVRRTTPCLAGRRMGMWHILRLHDEDEWRWALLARHHHTGSPLWLANDTHGTAFLPEQLRAGVDLLAGGRGADAQSAALERLLGAM